MGNLVSKREDGAEISIQSFISWSEIIGESREEDQVPRAEDQEGLARQTKPPVDHDSKLC